MSEYNIPRENQVSLFQAVTESQAVTTPLLSHSTGLMVHYSEGSMGTRLHWLNVLDNTTNTEYIQTGVKEVNYLTQIRCTAVNFTEVGGGLTEDKT